MIVRRAESKDIPRIAEIEKCTFSDAWSEQAIADSILKSRAWIYVIQKAEYEEVAAYVIFYPILDEGEIARIACIPEMRRQGAGSLLFYALEKECREKGIRTWHLDVRQRNHGAAAFYHKHGFHDVGIRKAYYDNPKEDAVLMTRVLETLSAVQEESLQI